MRAGLMKAYKRLRLSFVLFCLVMLSLLIGAIAYAVLPRPELLGFQNYSIAFFDSNNKLLKVQLANDQRYRLYTPLNDIPKQMQEAVILYEDQSFYEHSGVDFVALTRAFWQTYVMGERRVGASTLVMQVARLRWKIPSSTLQGKAQQIYRAIQLSKHYTKQELLEAYFNLAPYGGNVEGIGAASLIYFGKSPQSLSLAEILTLAVVPQNPNKRNPSKASGMLALQLAKQTLFERWTEYHPQDAEYARFVELPLTSSSTKTLPQLAPHFTQYVSTQLPPWYQYQFASSANNTLPNKNIQPDNKVGSKVVTSLDYKVQEVLEKALKGYVDQRTQSGITNASALLIDYQSMQIKAMIGSADFTSQAIQGQVNGTLAKRSPGSTLKPFVYALALDAGLIHPMTMLKDLPTRFAAFSPENYGRGFLGPVSATDALVKSRNVPAVALQSALIKRSQEQSDDLSLYQFMQKANVQNLKPEEHYGLALSLGGAELTMLELVQMYATLANGGKYRRATSILNSVLNENQTLREEASFNASHSEELLSPEASFLVLNMLSQNPPPAEYSVHTRQLDKESVAWKTGTSWAFRDAWAVAVSGKYVLAVWIGNFEGQGNNTFVGRTAAGPLLFKLLDVLSDQNTQRSGAQKNLINVLSSVLDKPNNLNISRVDVCGTTGDLYETDCPQKAQTWFIPGVSPIKSSNIYRRILVDKKTGLRRCDRDLSLGEWQVFEFWSSDFIEQYKKAGIFIQPVPAFMPRCNTTAVRQSAFHHDAGAALSQNEGQQASAPKIVSPLSNVEYLTSAQDTAQIELKATVAADTSTLHWFVDGRYIGRQGFGEQSVGEQSVGKQNSGEQNPQSNKALGENKSKIIWPAKPGRYIVSVADNHGRSVSVEVNIVVKAPGAS